MGGSVSDYVREGGGGENSTVTQGGCGETGKKNTQLSNRRSLAADDAEGQGGSEEGGGGEEDGVVGSRVSGRRESSDEIRPLFPETETAHPKHHAT